MYNSILCHIIKLPHICLYPDDSARQLFFFCTTFHILREIFLFVKVFLSFLYEFCMNLFCFLYRFCYIFHYPVFIFALSKIFLFLYCCFCYPFHFLTDLQLHDGRLMFHCRNNLLCLKMVQSVLKWRQDLRLSINGRMENGWFSICIIQHRIWNRWTVKSSRA